MRKSLAFGLLLVSASSAFSQTVYSNVTNFTGFGFLHGGSANLGGNTITTLHADDITPISGGLWVSQFTFSSGNADVANQTVRARVRFWEDDGAGGLPGTFLAGFDVPSITNPSGSAQTVTVNLAIGQFMMPTGRFWAGVAFDDDNGTLGSAGAMNQQGELIFTPATIGSSGDILFATSVAGDFFGVNNPAGSTFNFGGAPSASYAWEFVVAPEPSSCIFALGLSVLGWNGMRRLRRPAAA